MVVPLLSCPCCGWWRSSLVGGRTKRLWSTRFFLLHLQRCQVKEKGEENSSIRRFLGLFQWTVPAVFRLSSGCSVLAQCLSSLDGLHSLRGLVLPCDNPPSIFQLKTGHRQQRNNKERFNPGTGRDSIIVALCNLPCIGPP